MSRDKAVYASLKQAWLVSKEEREREAALGAAGAAGGVAFGRGAAGAVSAAVREMRPVEIVGLYEVQREGLDAELAAAKSEVGQGREGVDDKEKGAVEGVAREGDGPGARGAAREGSGES